MMKKLFLFFLSFIAIATISFAQKPNRQLMNYQKTGAPIPPFVLEKTAGGTMTNSELKKGKPVMLMIFSPQCDHCEHMIDSIKSWASKFKKTQLVLVAEDRNKQYMKGFITKTGIADDPMFQNIGTERGNLIPYLYTYKLLPQINFYNSHYKLVHSFTGLSPIDSIKMCIN